MQENISSIGGNNSNSGNSGTPIEGDSSSGKENSSAGEGGSENGNSDQADNASSEDTAFSVDGEGHTSSKSDRNPPTGVAVSFVPLAAAITVLMAAKRKKK